MIQEFNNAEYGTVRATIIDETPYFCLVDITRLLGISNAQTCRRDIPDIDIKRVEIKNGKSKKNQLFVKAKHISTCIFKSKKAEAEQINDWLYATVLPNMLNLLEYKVDSFSDPNKIIKLIDENRDLKVRNNVLETDMKILKPKVRYVDKLLGSAHCVDLDVVTKVIKYPGIHNSDLFKILRSTNILDENNQPYQEFCDRRYFRVIDSTVVVAGNIVNSQRTFVYKSGLAFIERILKEYEVNYDRNKRILHSA